MNCYSIDTNRKISRGIAIKGIDGVSLGSNHIVSFNQECFSDPQRHLSKMTFGELLVDADLADGEIGPKNPDSNNSLVRLTIEIGSAKESLFQGDGGLRISAIRKMNGPLEIEHVIGPGVYLHVDGVRWAQNISIILSMPPASSVCLTWTCQRVNSGWFGKTTYSKHLVALSMENGKPVFEQFY